MGKNFKQIYVSPAVASLVDAVANDIKTGVLDKDIGLDIKYFGRGTIVKLGALVLDYVNQSDLLEPDTPLAKYLNRALKDKAFWDKYKEE